MKNKVVIGIDTSNYTTSCAICDTNGVVLENYKELLPVKDGEKGLRQSDAVFAHVKNFQIISSKIKEKHEDYEIVAIGYSAYPRDAAGSYMPCFLVGQAVSEMIASLYNIYSFHFSHQAGHIQAALYSAKLNSNEPFVAFHVSGGTTEILLVTPKEGGYDISLIGGSDDLNAGQAIDRIGVHMGIPFPCGKQIENLAQSNTKKIPKCKICTKDLSCNLSGLENMAIKLYKETNDEYLVAAFTLEFISRTLEQLTDVIKQKYGDIKVVYAGGVMSNKIIQSNLAKKFENVYFSEPEFSSDNACGIAILTYKKFIK